MKLIKRSAYNPVLPTFFDDFFSRDLFGWDNNIPVLKSSPAVNIIENDDNYSIEVAAPGLSKEAFNVELDNDLLTISFEHKEEKEEAGKFTRREFHYTSFSRSFTLPKGAVNSDKIDARYENGILKLVLPKLEEAKTKAKKTITIG